MTKPRFRWTKWSWLWVVWLAAFLAVEIPAIVNSEEGDTLSEHIWALVSWSSLGWFVVGGFMLWLTAHFLGPRARRWINSWRRK